MSTPLFSMEPLEGRQLLATHGLTGTYFDNTNFSGHAVERVDPRVEFDFGNHASPAPGIKGNTFSVRWTGLVTPAYSETYTFHVRANDGVRLWVDGELLIDSWHRQPRTRHAGEIALLAGKQYDVRLEYVDYTRTAAVKLQWSSPTQPRTEVPHSRLFAYDERVAVIGDFGDGSPASRDTAHLVKTWAPDAIVTVGDNNYPTGEAATIDEHVGRDYHHFIGDYRGAYGEGSAENRFWPSLGNHDWQAGGSWSALANHAWQSARSWRAQLGQAPPWQTVGSKPYREYFTLPGNERYYDFARGPVHFFVVDSDPHEPDGVTPDSVQGQWLQEALAQSNSPFKVVYFHHAPYSSGESHGSSRWMRWPFEAWGADVVLAGHDHHYERLDVGGVPYFITGAGSHTRELGPPLVQTVARDNTDAGALLMQANDTVMTFQYQLRDGRILDMLSIGARGG